jgi:hypothetical protein
LDGIFDFCGYIGNLAGHAASARLAQHRKDGRRRTDLNRIHDLEAMSLVKGGI